MCTDWKQIMDLGPLVTSLLLFSCDVFYPTVHNPSIRFLSEAAVSLYRNELNVFH